MEIHKPLTLLRFVRMLSAINVLPMSLNGNTKRNAFITYALYPFLLAVAGYGLWRLIDLPMVAAGTGSLEILFLVGLVVAPLMAMMFFSVTASQNLGHTQLSRSYQTRLDHLQTRLNYQEDLMHAVMDCSPEAMTIFDRENRYWFINQRALKNMGREITDIIGKTPAKFMSHQRTRKLETRLTEVRNTGRSIETLEQISDASGIRFVQVHYETVAPVGDLSDGVIMREEDITTLILERERRESMLRQVISAMVAVVDRRDPYAAGHSARVGQLARAIAEELTLDEKQIEAAEIAGSLMNFGKVLVPRDILTKTTPLSSDELQRVRESILTSADILSIIEFPVPVVQTLRQALERFDGQGTPHGFKGEDILITARIVSVANTYVALVSPRAHRPSLGLQEALSQMMRDADKAYDRRVVAALNNYVENHPAKLDWLTRTKQA